MSWKKKIAKVAGTAALVAALMGTTSKPVTAETSTADTTKIEHLMEDRETAATYLDSLKEVTDKFNQFKKRLTHFTNRDPSKRALASLELYYHQMFMTRHDFYEIWLDYTNLALSHDLDFKAAINAYRGLEQVMGENIVDNLEQTKKRAKKEITKSNFNITEVLYRLLEGSVSSKEDLIIKKLDENLKKMGVKGTAPLSKSKKGIKTLEKTMDELRKAHIKIHKIL